MTCEYSSQSQLTSEQYSNWTTYKLCVKILGCWATSSSFFNVNDSVLTLAFSYNISI